MALGNGFLFLITSVFSLLTYALIFRFLSILLSKNRFNSLNQSLAQLIDPLVKPLRPLLPIVKRVDLALLAVIMMLQVLRLMALSMFSFMPFGVLVFVVAPIFTTLQQCINIVFFSIMFLVILSWINPSLSNPVTDAMFYLSDWLLSAIKRHIKPVSGFDISPIIAIIGLQFLNITFVNPFAI